MKILIYVGTWAPSVGGVETVTMILAQSLAKCEAPRPGEKIAVTLVTKTPADGMDDSTFRFRVVRRPGFAELVRLFREADLVHMAGPSLLPGVIAWLMRKPSVIEHHGFQTICPNGQLLYEPTQTPCPGHFMARRYGECLRCNSKLGRFTSAKMWMLTFPRRWFAQRMSANIAPTSWLGSLLQLNRTRTIPHGLPPLDPPARKPPSSKVTSFIFLGRLVSTKGVRVLIKAAGLLRTRNRNFRITIIGDGPERQELEILASDLGIQDIVQFLGYVPPERLEQNLADAAAVVMPSLGGEVFGLVAAENMQQGKLVIASDLGALSEVLGDAGMTFATGSAEDLARCMESVIADPSLTEPYGQKASQRIAQVFRADQMVSEHVRTYQEICGPLRADSD